MGGDEIELPELAIQRIQSFLSTKEAARSCLLSKSWLRSFSTHPSLDFDQSLLFGIDPMPYRYKECFDHGVAEQVRNKIADLVNTTLVRYTTQKLCIRKFRLSATILDCQDSADLVDEWIRVAIESGTNELHLVLSSYTLPETLLFSAKSFEVLDLTYCRFRDHQNHDVRRIDFCNLKKLVLMRVYIDDHTIASFISGSPLVENITLSDCIGFTRIKVSNLDHLKVLTIGGEKNQTFDIEAPNLEHFIFSSFSRSKTEPPLFYMNALSKLKKLYLSGANITDMSFNDLVRQLMVVSVLSLRDCDELESINISGCSLEMLFIDSCRKLVAVTVDAPKLYGFDYSCDNLGASVSFVNHSPRYLSIVLSVTCPGNLNTSWFLQLRGFLMNINHEVFLLRVHIKSSNQNCFSSANFLKTLDPLQAHSYRTEVEDLRVNVEALPSSSIRYPALLDGLFWCFHPTESLTIAWKGTNSNKESRAFSKFLHKKLLIDQNSKTYWWQCIKDGENLSSLYKKLMHRRNAGNYWLHYLKDAETWSWEDSKFRCDLGRDSIS